MIVEVQVFRHERLPGVSVCQIGEGPLKDGVPQQVLVRLGPGVAIPTHYHSTVAIMDPVYGVATILSEDQDSGKVVEPGRRVRFEAFARHGFQAGPQGFGFVSTNGGIVDAEGRWDIWFSGQS